MSIFLPLQVNDEMRTGAGGGLVAEGEMIEVVEISAEDAGKIFAAKVSKSPPWTLYGLMWFLSSKLPAMNTN